MKNTMRRLLATVLSVLMLIGCLPLSAVAEAAGQVTVVDQSNAVGLGGYAIKPFAASDSNDIPVAVYATDGYKEEYEDGIVVDRTNVMTGLNLKYIQDDWFYPMGVVYLPASLFADKSISYYIRREEDFEAVKDAIKEIDLSMLTNSGAANNENKIGQYLQYVRKDINKNTGEKSTALFDWTYGGEHGGNNSNILYTDRSNTYRPDTMFWSGNGYKYHLDIRFTTHTITYYGIDETEENPQQKLLGRGLYLDGTLIQEPWDMANLTKPEQNLDWAKWTKAGYYADPDFKTPYERIGKKIGFEDDEEKVVYDHDEVVYLKITKNIDIEVNKVWQGDEDNKYNTRPESITYRLKKSVKGAKTEINSATVGESDNWKAAFENLPRYEDGQLIEYSVEEDRVPGYSTTYQYNSSSASISCPASASKPTKPFPVTVTNKFTVKRGMNSSKAINAGESASAPDGVYKAGDTVVFDIAVQNTGNVPLEDVEVEELLSGAKFINGSDYTVIDDTHVKIPAIPVKGSVTVKAQYTIAPEDIASGSSVENKAKVTDPNDKVNQPQEPSVNVPLEDQNRAMTSRKAINAAESDAATDGAYKAGDEIVFDIIVENTGNVTLTGITVSEELEGATIEADTNDPAKYTVSGNEATIGEIPVNGSVTVKAKYTIQQKDIDAGSLTNTAAVTDPGDAESQPQKPSVNVPLGCPSLTVSKTSSKPANGNVFALGEKIYYEITVTNSGNVSIENITVKDDLTGDAWSIAKLGPGASDTRTVEYVVKSSDIVNGQVRNVATASAPNPYDPSYDSTLDPDDAKQPQVPSRPGEENVATEAADPQLTVKKTAYLMDKDNSLTKLENGDEVAVNDAVLYEIVVTNTGNVDLEGLQLSDVFAVNGETVSLADGWLNEDPTDPFDLTVDDRSKTFHVMYQVKPTDSTLVNTATVSQQGGALKASDTVTNGVKPNPYWTVLKLVNGVQRLADIEVGTVLTYTIEVKNAGNVNLEKLYLRDTFTGDADELRYVDLKSNLPEGESVCRTSYDADAKLRTLSNLAAGEIVTLTYIYPVQPTDSVINNTVTVSDNPNKKASFPIDQMSGTTTEVRENPDLTVTKKAYRVESDKGDKIVRSEEELSDIDCVVVGGKIAYEIIVKNTGNVPLKNLTVRDTLNGKGFSFTQDITNLDWFADPTAVVNLDAGTIDELVPGGYVRLTYTYTVKAGSKALDNQVIVTTNTPGVKLDPRTAGVKTDVAGITIAKSVSSSPSASGRYEEGDSITFNIKVTNTGSVDLCDVVVKEQLAGCKFVSNNLYVRSNSNRTATLKNSLKAGQSVTLVARYNVTKDFSGDLKNTASVTAKVDPNDSRTLSGEGSIVVNNPPPASVPDPEPTPEPTPAPMQGYVSISGRKSWVDNNNSAGMRPSQITVVVMQNGIVYQEQVVTEESGWTYSFVNLPDKDLATGTIYTYTIGERMVNGYTGSTRGFDLVNELIPAMANMGSMNGTGNLNGAGGIGGSGGSISGPGGSAGTGEMGAAYVNPFAPGATFDPSDPNHSQSGFVDSLMTEEQLELALLLFQYGTPLWNSPLKTGDELPIYPFVFGGVGLAAVLALLVGSRRKRKKK